jgi:N-acetylglutamate synthase-like GNAT family acetyltransferase
MKITFSNNRELLDINMIHNFLTNSYWSKGVTRERIENAIKNSFCFGIYDNNIQIGFARVTTDFTFFAYIADLFIIEEYRGIGLSKRLMEEILNHDKLKDIRSWMLATRDAHGLYEKFGFSKIDDISKFMIKKNLL